MKSDEISQRITRLAIALLVAFVATSCTSPEPKPESSGALDEAASAKARDSEKYGLPLHIDHRLYDDNPPVLPEDYPAKNDDVQGLLKRLVELASGSDITRAHIEKEFGIRFVAINKEQKSFDGIARGRYPIGNRFSFYTEYENGNVDAVLNLTNQLNSPSSYRKWELPPLCVVVLDFYDALGKDWRRFEPNKGTHYPVRIYYKKIVNGKSRSIEASPPSRTDRQCLESLSISDRELTLDELNSIRLAK